MVLRAEEFDQGLNQHVHNHISILHMHAWFQKHIHDLHLIRYGRMCLILDLILTTTSILQSIPHHIPITLLPSPFLPPFPFFPPQIQFKFQDYSSLFTSISFLFSSSFFSHFFHFSHSIKSISIPFTSCHSSSSSSSCYCVRVLLWSVMTQRDCGVLWGVCVL